MIWLKLTAPLAALAGVIALVVLTGPASVFAS